METIDTCYKNISKAPFTGRVYWHKFSLYTHEDGSQYAASAFTTENNCNSLSACGTITTVVGSFDVNHPDHPSYGTNSGKTYICYPTASSNDLSETWAKISNAYEESGNVGYTYLPAVQNSNSTLDSAYTQAGIKAPNPDNLWAPGSERSFRQPEK